MPTEAAQGIGEWTYEQHRTSHTETREDTDDVALQIGKRVWGYETNVEGVGPRETFAEPERPARDRQLSLSDTSALKSVPAVVTGIDEHSILITCQLPRGEVEIRLPKITVPSHLTVLHTPVSLCVDDSDGFSRPILVDREIERRAPTPQEVEVDEWIES